jgi:hypothetical protein
MNAHDPLAPRSGGSGVLPAHPPARVSIEPAAVVDDPVGAEERKPRVRENSIFLSTAPAGSTQRLLALTVVFLSGIIFLCVVPYVRVPLAAIAVFIPTYESALAITGLITSALLFGQAIRLRSRALLALAGGYLFNTLVIIPHALTFPDVFAVNGLLGAGDQTTAWLYVMWHGGFPLFVLAYAIMRDLPPLPRSYRMPLTTAVTAALVGAAVVLLVLLTTWGMDLLPTLIQGANYSLLITTGVSPAIWIVSLLALLAIIRRRPLTVLDLWLAVMMFAWLLDVSMSAIISSARYDLGWYAGRIYGLLAASLVLIVLLSEINSIQMHLADAQSAESRRDGQKNSRSAA